MKEFRFGIVGCGRIVDRHVSALKSLQGAKIVAVCDIKRDRADKWAAELKCKKFYDYEKMLKEKEIDVIDICTPSGLHSPMTVMAAEAGKHVVTEKPMALTVADADRAIKACKRAGVKFFVVKQNRFNPAVVKLREALDGGRFGKLVLGNTTVRWYRGTDYYGQDPWRGTKDMDGGVLLNQASHHVDLLQWMMGPVKSVKAFCATRTHDIEVEDAAVAAIKFKSGALGTIEATTSVYPKNLEGSLAIFGENGSVKIGGVAVNKIEVWEFRDRTNEDEMIVRNSSTNPSDVYGQGHLAYFENVIKVLKGGGKAMTDGEEGRKSVELINAIYKSAETGREVTL